jgi:hypothetical protein
MRSRKGEAVDTSSDECVQMENNTLSESEGYQSDASKAILALCKMVNKELSMV